MKVVDDTLAVVEALRKRALAKRPLIVSVDGLAGSGKSTLSEQLAVALPPAHLKVDSFVVSNQGSYLSHLRVSELKERVNSEMKADSVILVDGVCCAAILKRLAVQADLRIYVARLDDCGDWVDGELFTTGLTEVGAIEAEQSLLAPFGQSLTDLRRELIHYHFAFRPWEHCDIRYAHRDPPEA